MPVNKSSNSFKAGLNLSVDNINQPKDSYSYGLNIVKEDPVNNPEIITNERGFTTYLDLGYDYTLLGSTYLGLEDYCLFIKSPLGSGSPFNRILLVSNSISTIIFDSIDLNFQDSSVIKGTYRSDYRNQRIVYFVDGINKDRVINVDNYTIYSNDVTKISIDVEYIPAILTSRTVEDDGGNLVTGTYEFFASYKTVDNASTPWFILTANPVYVIDDNTQSVSADGYIIIDGCDSGLPTNKAIQLNIANLDSRFTNLRIGILKTIAGVQTARYIDNVFYSGNTLVYNYTGLSNDIIIPDATELLIDPVKYYGSNAITQMNNRLLRANTNSEKINIAYQSYANSIIVDYTVTEELVGTMADSTDYTVRSDWWKSANTKYSDTKSMLRDEVYSLGIAFGLIKEGVESEVYHIPGRAIDSIPSGFTYINQYNDTATLPYSSTWDSSPIIENGDNISQWKVLNTAALSNDDAVHKCAYWESAEVYPDGLDLPITGSSSTGVNNTPIRHHKMPSSGLEPIFRSSTDGTTITFYKRHLGLSFTNIVVPDTIKDNISYIRIYMTPRTTDANKSIIAKGVFTNCSLTKINIGSFDVVSDAFYVKPCSPFNDQFEIFNGGCYKDAQDDGWNTTNNFYHSFYSPDTTLRNPTLTTDKIMIENELTGVAQYYNTLAGLINTDPFLHSSYDPLTGTNSSINGGYKRDYFYDDSNGGRTLPTGQTSSHAVMNVTPGVFRSTYKAISILNNINQVSIADSRRKLKQAVYVPFNANLSVDQLGGMDNPYLSEYGSSNVLIELNTSYDLLGATQTTDTSFQFTDNNNSNNVSDPDQGSDKSGTFHQHTITSPLIVYRYGSLKRENSSQYNTIDSIQYNPTDLVIANPTFDGGNSLEQDCSGLIGDSWIDMFSVKRSKFFQKEHYTFGGKPEIAIGISTFFTESNINHRLRYAEGTTFQEYYPKQVLSTQIKLYLDATDDPYIFFNDNYYKDNNDFSLQVTKKNIGQSQLDVLTFGITKYSTRILYSDPLLNESIVDSYRAFEANSYRDLPKDKGFITHLFKKNQELYTVTRDSLYRVFTATETFKSGTEQVSVGTGEFLSLEPIEMLSIEGGHGGSSSKSSLVECSYGYFYVDKNKGKLILFKDRQSYYDNSQQVDISLLGVFDFVRKNFKLSNDSLIEFDEPLLNSGYVAGYDPELKRILITKLDYILTDAQLELFQGEFNPESTYTAGDIYTRDGVYYVFDSTSSVWNTVESSSDLSDFIQGPHDTPNFAFTTPSTGTASKIDRNTISYTSDTDGDSDTFTITMNCDTTTVNVTPVSAPPTNSVIVNNTTDDFTIAFISFSSGPSSPPNITTVLAGQSRSTTIVAGTYDITVKILSSIDGGSGLLTFDSNGVITTNSVSPMGLTVTSTSQHTPYIIQLDPA